MKWRKPWVKIWPYCSIYHELCRSKVYFTNKSDRNIQVYATTRWVRLNTERLWTINKKWETEQIVKVTINEDEHKKLLLLV